MGKPVVICVDDEPTVLESLKIELKQVLGEDCLVETAETGEEALSLFQELQADDSEVAVVLADYIMPGLRGDELMQQIHALSPKTLNIMISGQADLEAVAKAIRHARLYRYIAKPWNSGDLKETVVDAIQSYLQDRKLESQSQQLQELYRQVLDLSGNLEQQVQARTAELREAIAELERVSRIKDDFLNTVSHELRSPMSNIRMATEMLEVQLINLGVLADGINNIRRYFYILKEECEREYSLINDLLDLARLGANPEPLLLRQIDLNTWLPYMADAFTERAASQQTQIQLDLSSPLPVIVTDLTELERIVVELLNNACKYTPVGGTIRIRAYAAQIAIPWPATADTPETPPETLPETVITDIPPSTPSPVLVLEVSNTGVVLSEQQLERVFEQFYRIPESDTRQQGGTGLGLAIVKKRVERLQGNIKATHQEGWITFRILLPSSS